MPEHDLVHILSADPGMGQGLVRHPHDQALDGFRIQFAEGRVSPAYDAGRHGDVLDDGGVARRNGPARRVPQDRGTQAFRVDRLRLARRTEKWTRFSVATDAPARGMERRTEKWTRFSVATDAPARGMEHRINPKSGSHFSVRCSSAPRAVPSSLVGAHL